MGNCVERGHEEDVAVEQIARGGVRCTSELSE